MKIVNSIIRDSDNSGSTIQQTTRIEDLTESSELIDDSLFLIACNNSDNNNSYTAQKIEAGTLKNKLFESVQNEFKTSYWNLHITDTDVTGDTTHASYLLDTDKSSINPFSDKYQDICKYIVSYVKNNYNDLEDLKRSDNFTRHLNYDFETLTRYVIGSDNELRGLINSVDKRIDEAACHFAPEMTLTTTDYNDKSVNKSVINDRNVDNNDEEHCQMTISDGQVLSTEWKVPATGNLVVYGWLDSSEVLNNKAIPSSYCVLEAKINGNWEVIGIQSVIPAKNITYVGFNALVKKDLEIRVRTGFPVGAKSGQYAGEQDGFNTISNNTPNGFKCQVFSIKNNNEEGNDNDDNA